MWERLRGVFLIKQHTLIISAWVFDLEAEKAPIYNLVSAYLIMLYENNMFALPFHSPQTDSILNNQSEKTVDQHQAVSKIMYFNSFSL